MKPGQATTNQAAGSRSDQNDVCGSVEVIAAMECGKFIKTTPRRLPGRRLHLENLP